MDAEQIKTLFDMRMAKYPDHACLTQELTFKDEKIAALEAENARLKEALREVNDYLGEGCPISQIISRFADDFVASGSQEGLVEKGEVLQAALAKLEVEA